ncbi:alanine racemase [Staphylococcus auricularis]|uniref:alanine racemase n=1 Tax=Staphylococcus auricularis TaxID=29379 RepID=UPI001BCE4F84|nr:alanine racemase [Staphylococcus auricularis]
MSDKYYRPTRVNVDLDAITSNYQMFGKLHPNKTVIPVVKANGYGLGSVAIARHLMDIGANFFAVATLDEAVELRMHGVDARILVLGVIPPEHINKAIQHRVAMTVPDLTWMKKAVSYVDEENEKRMWFHVKIDTGMGRLGVKSAHEYKEIVSLIQSTSNMIFEGVFTHFPTSDEDTDAMKVQQEQFEAIVNEVEHPPFVHSQNSAASLLKDSQFCNAVRVGISLYGYYPSEYVKENVKVHLKPSAQWVTEIVQTKKLKAGESVSYGSTFTADQDMTIGIIPVGYADGYLRMMQGFTVNVNGEQCEIIGRVCMDQTIIAISDYVKPGAQVILMDHRSDVPQSCEALARQQQTINYEVLCNLSRRLPRVYYKGEDVEIKNELLK